jgi:acetyl esterase/lipase
MTFLQVEGSALAWPTMPEAQNGTDAFGRVPRPVFDPTSATLAALLPAPVVDPQASQAGAGPAFETIDTLRNRCDFDYAQHSIATPDGGAFTVSVFSAPRQERDLEPGYLFIHGGGLVAGDEFLVTDAIPTLAAHGGVLVSVGYRLAPEHPAPTALRDCYQALEWLVANAGQLGIDTKRIILMGGSAGAGLAAGVALLARDLQGPPLLGLLLNCPMLDDRCDSVSQQQFADVGTWSGRSNAQAWRVYLATERPAEGTEYVVPARARWLGGLPPMLITVSSCDPFRDEDVDFASRVWRDGGDCELYVSPGGVHGHESFAPTTAIGRNTLAVVAAWVARTLEPDDEEVVARTTTELERLGLV